MDPITIGIACLIGWAAHCNDKVLAAEAAAQVETTIDPDDLDDPDDLGPIFCHSCGDIVESAFCARCGTPAA